MTQIPVRDIAISAVLVSALIALFVLRIVGPARAPYDLDDCLRAYARARTPADTLKVDVHPFPGIEGDTIRRCGALRGID